MRFAKFQLQDSNGEILIGKDAVSHILPGGEGSNVSFVNGETIWVKAKPEEIAAKLEQL